VKPQLPDALKDFLADHTGGKGPNAALLAFCQREAFHAQWDAILDDDFVKAYQDGIVVKCSDGLERRFYPRIFAYSADYPEKYVIRRQSRTDRFSFMICRRVLISLIRNRGLCCCPRCLIPMKRFQNLGKKLDARQRVSLVRVNDDVHAEKVVNARQAIYQDRYAVDGRRVEDSLKEESWVPNVVSWLESNCASCSYSLFLECLLKEAGTVRLPDI
jgi:hypothetical protein